jgi:hypothetical protein
MVWNDFSKKAIDYANGGGETAPMAKVGDTVELFGLDFIVCKIGENDVVELFCKACGGFVNCTGYALAQIVQTGCMAEFFLSDDKMFLCQYVTKVEKEC